MAKLILTNKDYSDEESQMQVYVADAITDPDITLLHNALVELAYDGWQQTILRIDAGKDGADGPKAANPESQREKKWLFRFTGNKSYTREMPAAELTNLSSDGEDIDLTAGVGLAVKTEWDKSVLGDAGEATTLERVSFVGRNI